MVRSRENHSPSDFSEVMNKNEVSIESGQPAYSDTNGDFLPYWVEYDRETVSSETMEYPRVIARMPCLTGLDTGAGNRRLYGGTMFNWLMDRKHRWVNIAAMLIFTAGVGYLGITRFIPEKKVDNKPVVEDRFVIDTPKTEPTSAMSIARITTDTMKSVTESPSFWSEGSSLNITQQPYDKDHLPSLGTHSLLTVVDPYTPGEKDQAGQPENFGSGENVWTPDNFASSYISGYAPNNQTQPDYADMNIPPTSWDEVSQSAVCESINAESLYSQAPMKNEINRFSATDTLSNSATNGYDVRAVGAVNPVPDNFGQNGYLPDYSGTEPYSGNVVAANSVDSNRYTGYGMNNQSDNIGIKNPNTGSVYPENGIATNYPSTDNVPMISMNGRENYNSPSSVNNMPVQQNSGNTMIYGNPDSGGMAVNQPAVSLGQNNYELNDGSGNMALIGYPENRIYADAQNNAPVAVENNLMDQRVKQTSGQFLPYATGTSDAGNPVSAQRDNTNVVSISTDVRQSGVNSDHPGTGVRETTSYSSVYDQGMNGTGRNRW